MTQAEARNLVREYEGKDIEKVGTHLPDKSSYNYNFYRLPNGTEVLMDNDDDGYNMVFVCDGGNNIYVGAQYDDGELMIGDFT